MKIAWLLLGLMLALWIVISSALLRAEPPHSHGMPHERYPEMAQGGSGMQRHGQLLWTGWAFGSLQMMTFVALLALGVHREDHARRLTGPLLLGLAIALAVFGALMITYRQFLLATDSDLAQVAFLGPFPVPTTLMLVGIWGAGFSFVVLYVVAFPRCIYTREDAIRFQELLAQHRSEEDAT